MKPKHDARPHQKRGLQIVRESLDAGRREPVVFYVTMGGGKTRMYVDAIELAVSRGHSGFAYVPTEVIAEGLREKLNERGLKPTRLRKNRAPMLDSDRNVVVATYAQLAREPHLHADQIRRKNGIVVCDEIHHCGAQQDDADDPLAFAFGVEQAWNVSALTIYGTGTPYRADDRRLPGTTYGAEDSEGRRLINADVTLPIGEALALGYIRPVHFRYFDGKEVVERYNGEEQRVWLHDKDRGLSSVCRDRANWQPLVNCCIDELGGGRMLITATDIRLAESIHAEVKRGRPDLFPLCVTSDDDSAAQLLSAFGESNSRCLITVAMASEGFDCPSLTHLVYVSARRTALSMDQAVGRVTRNDGSVAEAFVYGLGDSIWLDYAAHYEEEQRAGRRERDRIERDKGSDDGERVSRLEYVGTTGDSNLTSMTGGTTYDQQKIAYLATEFDLPQRKVVDVLRASDAYQIQEEPVEDENSDENRAEYGRRVFGKGGLLPRLQYELFGYNRNQGGLQRACKRRYLERWGLVKDKKPYPIEITQRFEDVAKELASAETRPSWFQKEVDEWNPSNS